MRSAAARVATVSLLLFGLIRAGALLAPARVASSFNTRSADHLQQETARIRADIAQVEAAIDSDVTRIAAAITRKPNASRAELFSIVSSAGGDPRRGARIVDATDNPIAWSGENLPVRGLASYEFDVTSLYIVRSRPLPVGTLQVFERIVNQPRAHSLLDPDDDWIAGTIFHGGALRAEPGVKRFVIEKRPDATLFLDVTPRGVADVAASAKSDVIDLAALVLAIGTLLTLVLFGVRRNPWVTIALIAVARVAMLPLTVDEDPARIFRFDVFASRILGPFSKSPFDLLLTGAAILAVVVALTPALVRLRTLLAHVARAALGLAAGYGFVLLVRNLVDNSRISSIPDHIAPQSAAQGVLLAALLLFGMALLQLMRHNATRAQTLLAILVAALPAAYLVWLRGATTGGALAAVFGAVALALLVNAMTSRESLRLLATALLMMLVVYVPLQRFELKSQRKFIAETYAPLVAGEAVQLRTMIEDTLTNEFSHVELSTILADDYTKMSLEDLAYALWLRSDFSKWRVPAVITVRDIFGRPVSRFGVGLPQFSERRAGEQGEVLQFGSLTRVLIHHDFELMAGGIPIGDGSVHVVNPADPGATSFADVYRDFFEPSFEDTTTGLHAQREPVVYERNGNIHGNPTFRLTQSPAWYFASLKPGAGTWVRSGSAEVWVRRSDNALYAFPLQVPTKAQAVRRAGGVAIWAIALALLAYTVRSLPLLLSLHTAPRNLDFRTRTSLAVAAVVVLPLLVFVLFVRAYLAGRIEAEYLDRSQSALNAAERVIEDYLASQQSTRPEQVLDDDVLSWLARVIGHDLHLYRDDDLIASSRRDLFTAHIESERLPGDVYSDIVLHGRQLRRATRTSGTSQFIEIYSPITLGHGESYTLALPFIVQGRQIEAQVGDLATTIYLLLVFIVLASIFVAFRTARSVTRPVQALVSGARAVARGDFDIDLRAPSDPDLGLLVTTFRDMAQSIRRQQNDLRHERDRLQTLLENINAAVVVLDGALHPGAMNLIARKLFPNDQLPDEIREFIQRRASSEELALTVDGKPRTFRVSKIPLPESDEAMLIAEDVTEILRSNSLEAWGEMARQVAHEIKNPLTPIQLTAEHLRAVADRDDPQLPHVVRTAVDNILRQVVTLRETSKEFGDYASLRQPQRRPLDLKHLLQEIAASYADSKERGIDFRADIAPSTPATFSGDPRLLRGAIANLIENAFHAAPGGTVRLASNAFDSRVVVSVEDSGPGVPPDLLPKIFDPYFSTKSFGTGLGLAIARKAVEDHGGSVHAENLNPGFRISIELPVRAT